MSPEEKIRSYIPLVDFIAEVASPGSEVVLLDVRAGDGALVAVRGCHGSGRRTGEPLRDHEMRLLSQGRREGKSRITVYTGKPGSSGKFLRSSTYFIRGGDGESIGMLCVNTDMSAYADMHRLLSQMFEAGDVSGGEPENSVGGGKDLTVKEMVETVMEQVLDRYAADPFHMTGEEKKEAVGILAEKGVFMLKGTIAQVARRLEVSEQTVYRYLK